MAENKETKNNEMINEPVVDQDAGKAPEEIDDDAVIFKEKKRSLLFGLPLSFTKYTITPTLLTINQGFFKSVENDCYMYKIQDVRLTRTIGEKLTGLGTVCCFTGDTTNPEICLVHIKHAKEVKTYLLKQSEIARLKRRTLNTMDIGVNAPDLDGNGIPDIFE